MTTWSIEVWLYFFQIRCYLFRFQLPVKVYTIQKDIAFPKCRFRLFLIDLRYSFFAIGESWRIDFFALYAFEDNFIWRMFIPDHHFSTISMNPSLTFIALYPLFPIICRLIVDLLAIQTILFQIILFHTNFT